jgi:serine/threonine-protein kinase
VLPDAVANDAERLARFTREAQTLGSLNHPNIAHVHGLEESPSTGVRAIVMELVEGEDLSQRIARGAIPLDESLPIAKQIAEALEAAHEQGIIHRDLKPANIKVRPDGTVKVLDFGLAKAMEPAGSSANVSQSPTIATPAMTVAGVILGTAAYMSPEQARGKTVDKRADIWAFGAVLFEMLTGKRAFDGEDVGDTLAAVLRAEPDWNLLPAEAAFPVRTLLRGCLEKDPRQRIADISAALFVLRHQANVTATEVQAAPDSGGRGGLRRIALFTAAALVLGAVAAGTSVWLLNRSTTPLSVLRTTIAASGPTALVTSDVNPSIAITPDGSRIVYRGNNQLLVRALDQLQPTALSGLGAPLGVFLSPDGLWVGFFDGNTAIKKVSITGGPTETVCALGQGVPTGATWGPDGTIIFGTFTAGRGLQRVPAGGGEPTSLTQIDRSRGEGGHVWPEFLPDGKAVLFTILPPNGSIDSAQVAVLDLRTGASKVLIRGGSHARYVPTGHLVYGVSGTLRVAFELERLEVVGAPAAVLEGRGDDGPRSRRDQIGCNGSRLHCRRRFCRKPSDRVASVDRQDVPQLPGIPLDAYRTLRVSPDGTKLALATNEHFSIYDFARATLSRLTTDATHDSNPLWTPDSQRIVFTSRPAGYPELFVRRADGTGSVERVLGRAKDLVDLIPDGWSKDGRQLMFSEVTASIQCAIGQVTFERPSDATLLVKGDGCSVFATVSPDGHSIAYTAGTPLASRFDVYVERYPELGSRQMISTGGGDVAAWSRDGRELFFKSTDGRQMFAVPIQPGTTLVAGRPQVLFEVAMPPSGGGYRAYDIAPDGRFVIIQSALANASGAPQIIVVQNWFEELKRLVPTAGR